MLAHLFKNLNYSIKFVLFYSSKIITIKFEFHTKFYNKMDAIINVF